MNKNKQKNEKSRFPRACSPTYSVQMVLILPGVGLLTSYIDGERFNTIRQVSIEPFHYFDSKKLKKHWSNILITKFEIFSLKIEIFTNFPSENLKTCPIRFIFSGNGPDTSTIDCERYRTIGQLFLGFQDHPMSFTCQE